MRLLAEISFRGLFYFITDKYYRRFIGLVLRYGDQARHKGFVAKLHGKAWQIADAASFIWQYKEIFTDRSYHFKTNAPSPVIYDCGSNIGMSCLYYHIHYPTARIVAFEPDPQIGQLLANNLEQLQHPGLLLRREAVWTTDGTMAFYQHDVDGGSVLAGGASHSVNVPTIDLRKVLEQEKHIDFLKIDIEGAESALLPHIAPALGHVQHLFIEYHSYPKEAQNLGEILGILEKTGFRYYLMTQNRRKMPLVNRQLDKNMDYQTNIYAYRA
jgi:FkbM family methyltransferase